jgi:hypothetical protein
MRPSPEGTPRVLHAKCYLISPKIQNEIVVICDDIIIEDITNLVLQSGSFSVPADEISGMEQLPLCIRYVYNVEKGVYRVREDFIGFAPV